MIDKNSEKYRRFCEAKHALRMTKFKRDIYLSGVKQKRGEDGYWLLVEDIEKLEEKLNKNG